MGELDIFQKNLEALKLVQPELAGLLSLEKTTDRWSSFETELRYENSSSSRLFGRITQNLNAEKLIDDARTSSEALQQSIASLKISERGLIPILGGALGVLAFETLKQNTKDQPKVLVIEDSVNSIFASFSCFDFSPYIQKMQIHWMLVKNPLDLRTKIQDFLHSHIGLQKKIELIQNENWRQLRPDIFQGYVDAFYEGVIGALWGLGNSSEDTLVGLTNEIENIDYMLKGSGLGLLKNSFFGQTAISLASGPSLAEHLDFIKSLEGRVPLICAESTLKPLTEKGIYPDFVTALERDEFAADCLAVVKDTKQTRLICPPLLVRRGLDHFFPNILFFNHPAYPFLKVEEFGLIEIGQSSGNLNVDALIFMGFRNIILVGHDLGYDLKSGKSHVPGTINLERQQERSADELKKRSLGIQFESQDSSTRVLSDPFYAMFKQQIESRLVQFPDLKIINSSLKGSKIEGALTMELKEAVTKFQSPQEFRTKINSTVKTPSKDEISQRRRQLLESIETSKIHYEFWRDEFANVRKDWEKWRSEKNPEPSQLQDFAHQLMEMKKGMINVDQAFRASFLRVIQPIVIQAEQETNSQLLKLNSEFERSKAFLPLMAPYFELFEKEGPQYFELLSRASSILTDI